MEQQVQDALSVLFGKLTKETPELTDVMERAKRGEITELEAMQEMLRLVQANPTLETKVTSLSKQAFGGRAKPSEMLFQPTTTDAVKMNPLVAGALVERLQFDGDIPELRTGPMPRGVLPAIPIATGAVDPAYIGRQLQQASEDLQKKLESHHKERITNLEAIAGQIGSGTLAQIEHHGKLLARQSDAVAWGSAKTDLPEYRRGRVPAPVTTPKVSGSALACMTPGQRHEMAWRFLSTTQGRLTAVQAVQEIVEEELKNASIQVNVRAFNPDVKREPLASHEWTLTMSGPGATQPAFSFITVAARAIAKGLVRKLDGKKPAGMILEIAPVNRLADRVVGWAGRILPPR